MFIGIIGTSCSGKKTVLEYFIQKGFRQFTIGDEPVSASELATSSGGDTAHPVAPESFATSSAMLDHATKNWLVNCVTLSLKQKQDIETFSKRPFFLLINVDGPVMMRWARHTQRASNKGSLTGGGLEEFLLANDRLIYGDSSSNSSPLSDILKAVPHVTVINSYETRQQLYSHIDSLNPLDHERLRPSWDSYYMTLSELASHRSNCMKRRVGAILVRNNRIVATGYNGTPRGLKNCNEGGCGRCNSLARIGEALDECLCLHAEENALLEAGRDRVGDGAVLYCNTCPCLRCSVKIVQTGVREVVYNFAYSMDEASARVFKEAGVKLRQHAPRY